MLSILITLLTQALTVLLIIFLLLTVLGLKFPAARAARRVMTRLLWKLAAVSAQWLWRPEFRREGAAHVVTDPERQEEGHEVSR